MPFARSIASEMIGENDVFSWARSISLATITRLLWTTDRGDRVDLHAGCEASVMIRLPNASMTARVAGLDDRRRVELLDDGRALQRVAGTQRRARDDRRVHPCAGEPDACGARAPALRALGAAAASSVRSGLVPLAPADHRRAQRREHRRHLREVDVEALAIQRLERVERRAAVESGALRGHAHHVRLALVLQVGFVQHVDAA